MGGKRNKENDIIIQTVGGQSSQVTGSCTTVSWNTDKGRRHLLVDLGMKQGGSMWDEYIENKQMLDDIPIKYAKYCFITHLHFDHLGLLPVLKPRGFEGKIITTNGNRLLSPITLKDGTKIHVSNCIHLREKGKKAKELYTMKDMWGSIDLMNTYSKGEIHKLDDYVSFRYTSNSHIIEATQLELFIRKHGTNVTKKIVFTGDLGNTDNFEFNYFAEKTIPVSNCDALFIESTYGKSNRNFNKKDCIREREEMKHDIFNFINSRNSVLIPCFSLSRLQNLMCWIYDNLRDEWDENIPIVIDTNLGNILNKALYKILDGEDLEYWDRVMNYKAFKFIDSYEGSIAFLTSKQHALILSSGGMISGGRSVLHAKQILGNSDGAILFCGYCSPTTLGGQILDDTLDKVEVEGVTCLKRCTIKRFSSFSSHSSQKDLISYIKQCNCNHVILMHGDEEAKEELKSKADEELSKMNRTTKVVCSYKDYILRL